MPLEIAGLKVERVTPRAPARANPILFLHGMWGGSWMWDHYLGFFAGRGYTGYALNLRGHHGSKPVDDIGRVRFADYLADARAAAAAIGNPIIVGHSMGGLLAARARVRAHGIRRGGEGCARGRRAGAVPDARRRGAGGPHHARQDGREDRGEVPGGAPRLRRARPHGGAGAGLGADRRRGRELARQGGAMKALRDKYCIVGVGETEYSRASNRTTRAMAVEAVRHAILDAGLTAGDVDGMLDYQGGDSTLANHVAPDLGIRLNFYMDVMGGGSSTEALVGLAMGD